MPPKGWTSGRPEGLVKAVRLTEATIERIARHVGRLQAQLPFVRVNEGMAIRNLIDIGLDTVETGTVQAVQAAAPLEATATPPQAMPEPAPPLVTHETLTPEPDTQLSLTPAPLPPAPPPAPTGRTPPTGRTRGLSTETLQAIADERVQCQGLSMQDFAQRLYDRGILSATTKDGKKVPANKGNISKWLKQAEEQGML
jgi:hypothetical protein